MRSAILTSLLALGVTLIFTPIIRNISLRLGFVDKPAKRKNHVTPIPLMGGVAIFAGAVLAILIIYRGDLPKQVLGITLAGSVMALLGLIDDRIGLSAGVKMIGQIIAIGVLVYFNVFVKLPIPLFLNYFLTFLWILTITNAINFLDNMDGLSAGISGISATFIMLLGVMNGQLLVSSLAGAIAGACFGFLRYNFRPAKIFMGDAGSMFLGFILAVLALELRFLDNINLVTWMVPLLVLGVPLFDICFVVYSRLRRGVSPATAGKDHTNFRLVRAGTSQREAVLAMYLIGGMFGLAGLFIALSGVLEGYLIGAIIFISAVYIGLQLDNKYPIK